MTPLESASTAVRSKAAFAPWAEPVLTTAAELMALPEDGWHYELVEGRLVRMSPTGLGHGHTVMRLLLAIGSFVEERELGEVLPPETGFWISVEGAPDTVLAPDLAFVRRGRLALDASAGYARINPDFVVEVASASQGHRELSAKAKRWLDAGVELVWIVLPKSRRVEIWRGGQVQRVAAGEDDLSGEDVLPGFVMSAAQLFS